MLKIFLKNIKFYSHNHNMVFKTHKNAGGKFRLKNYRLWVASKCTFHFIDENFYPDLTIIGFLSHPEVFFKMSRYSAHEISWTSFLSFFLNF